MTIPFAPDIVSAPALNPAAVIRARAAANARSLLSLAHVARRDGLPHAEMRAANARAAARNVLAHARRMAAICPVALDDIPTSELAQ
jgi:hypothetical protein